MDYEKSVKKLEALVDPLEKNRLEKEKKKLMKKISECEILKNSKSELDKYAKDKIDKLPLFISNLSKIEQIKMKKQERKFKKMRNERLEVEKSIY